MQVLEISTKPSKPMGKTEGYLHLPAAQAGIDEAGLMFRADGMPVDVPAWSADRIEMDVRPRRTIADWLRSVGRE